MSTHELFAARGAQARGDLTAAKRLYRRILDASPASLAAAVPLASILEAQGLPGEAVVVLQPVVRRHPGNYEAVVQLGRCLLRSGHAAHAIPMLERAIMGAPKLVDARIWLAECLLVCHRPDKAIAAVASVPQDHRARSLMGRAYMFVGRSTEGLEHLRAAAAMHPQPRQQTELASALEWRGELDEALAGYEAVIAADPDWLPAIAGRASVLQSKGRHDEAIAALEPALERANSDVAMIYARLARTPQERARAIATLDRVLQTPSSDGLPFATLQSARGALLEREGNYDEAFAAFRAANESSPAVFDRASYDRSMGEILKEYSPDRTPGLSKASNADPLPVFIVGMPRSGSSLVEQILACHPDVFGAGELDDLLRLVRQIPETLGDGRPFPACVPSLSTAQLDRLAGGYLERLRARAPHAARITDKMPQNFMFLGLIEQLFPGSRIIHCVRDPLDTCVSCYTTALSGGHAYRRRLPDLAAVYGAYRGAMDHWRGALRIPVLDVRYEDLVADPEPNIRRLVDFIGLPWDARCLRPHANPRHVPTASMDQVRRPIHRASVQRWRRFERHLGPLIHELRPWL